MELEYIQDAVFEKYHHTDKPLPQAEYEGCQFINCDLSNSDMSGMQFAECTFQGCDLSLVKLSKTTLRDVQFKNCKIMGVHFEDCNEFGLAVSFEDCILDHSSFYRVKLKKTLFKNTRMHETDLTEADLTSAVFDSCDLLHTTFSGTILERADLRTACNYSIDPERNKIKKARFSYSGIKGLLDKYDIEISMD